MICKSLLSGFISILQSIHTFLELGLEAVFCLVFLGRSYTEVSANNALQTQSNN